MATNTELYDTLNLSKNATQEEIKRAFRKKAIECHPDKNAGDKEKETQFKKLNEAYSILSDPEKRKMYDQFGITDTNQGGQGGGVDINDILSGMFGGMGGMPGMGGGPGGFSFVFMNGDDGEAGEMPDDFMNNFFGGARQRQQKVADVISIPIDICDIYYGKNKKVEFELLDLCSKCNGTGAADPAFVIKCLTCNGKGSISQQIGPFFSQSMQCHSCAGSGSTIKNNKICQSCKGKKTVYNKRSFELKIPKGIPNGHEIRMDDKGSYDERIKKNKDILFRFRWEVAYPYEIDADGTVRYNYNIPLEDLLAGFDRNIKIYNEDVILKSDHYINPNNQITVPGMGIFNIKKNKHMDLLIKLSPIYNDNDRLIKYNDVIRKIFKKVKDDEAQEETKDKKVICLSK
jgi:DnaJ-class molecular chaperone